MRSKILLTASLITILLGSWIASGIDYAGRPIHVLDVLVRAQGSNPGYDNYDAWTCNSFNVFGTGYTPAQNCSAGPGNHCVSCASGSTPGKTVTGNQTSSGFVAAGTIVCASGSTYHGVCFGSFCDPTWGGPFICNNISNLQHE